MNIATLKFENIEYGCPDQGRENETVCAQCGTVGFINEKGYCQSCARIIQSYVDFMRENQKQELADCAQYKAECEEEDERNNPCNSCPLHGSFSSDALICCASCRHYD